MKRTLKLIAVAAIAAWLSAQALAPPAARPQSDFMPAGALLYLEASDFNRLLTGWNASPEKKAWLDSQNYQVFLRSHLVTRLAEARKAYLEAASLPETAPVLDAVAGTESAIAIYNIGKLEFLYTTRLNAGQFAGSSLAAARGKFETRKAGNFNYFIRAKGDSSIAFALANDRLVLATREDLIATALKLASGASAPNLSPNLSKDPWFAEALAKSPALTSLRLLTDLAHVTQTPQFRSYWIQRNITQLKQFTTSIANITIDDGAIREDRILLRKEPAENLQPVEAAVASLVRFVPPDAGFYRGIAKPSQESVIALLKDGLFGAAEAAGPTVSRFAPPAPDSGATDAEDDFDTRVDQPADASADPSGDPFSPLTSIAANTDAILHSGAARLEDDRVLVGLPTAIILHGQSPWKLAGVKRDLGQIAATLWANATWTDHGTNGSELAAGATPLSVSIVENVLILTTSPQWMNRPLSTRLLTAPPASYLAVYRHAQELPLFERLTRLVDFPQIPQGNDSREPLFFSENIASLARSLGRLDTISVTGHDTGASVQQTVVYKLK